MLVLTGVPEAVVAADTAMVGSADVASVKK